MCYRSMEDAVRHMCPDIVHDVVVVGKNRPMPVLIVETALPSSDLDHSAHHTMAAQMVEKMTKYNHDKFYYTRVDDPKRILFVDKGALPRNKEKGNVRYVVLIFHGPHSLTSIRRNATEEKYKELIDAVFGA
jgi:hypothetical protein